MEKDLFYIELYQYQRDKPLKDWDGISYPGYEVALNQAKEFIDKL